MVKTNDVDNQIFFLKKVIDRNYRKLNGSVGTNQKKTHQQRKLIKNTKEKIRNRITNNSDSTCPNIKRRSFFESFTNSQWYRNSIRN